MRKGRVRKLSSVLITLLFLATIILPSNVVAAKEGNLTFSTATVNPQFIKYQQEKESGILNTNNLPMVLSDEEGKLGYIPSPVENPFKVNKKKQSLSKGGVTSTSLPAEFDLRNVTNKLSPVRNQDPYGSCWTFATYGSLESNLRPSEVNDFSEDNLMNTHGGDWGPNDGGNENLSMAYLSRWSGSISESEDPYNTPNTQADLKVQKHVQNVDYITGTSLSNLYTNIKQAINSDGALYTNMFWSDYFYDSVNNSYFCDYNYEDLGTNHAVTIVGWDDNFSKDKFNTSWGSKPQANGAFIIRNSWGSSWGEDGYFYISYDDLYSCLNNVSFNNAESVNNYDSIYQYDTLGKCTSIGYGSETAYATNVFTAISNQTLGATGFYTNAPNTSYEIKIYDTVNGKDFSGLKATKSGTIANMGYHTVKLDTGVQLTENKEFAVSIKLTTPDYNYPIAIEMPFSNYSSKAKAKSRESYLSSNGSDWYDLVTDIGYTNTNVCIKAFTQNSNIPSSISELTPPDGTYLNKGNPVISAIVQSSAGVDIDKITMKVDNSPVIISYNESTGLISHSPSISLNEGQHTVTINLTDKNLKSVNASWKFNTDTVAPTILSTTINDVIPINSPLTITFNEIIDSNSDLSNIKLTDSQNKSIVVNSYIKDKTLNIVALPGSLKEKGIYTINVPKEVIKDLVGNNITQTFNKTFKIASTTGKLKSLTVDPKSVSIVVGNCTKINVNAIYTDDLKTIVPVTDSAIAKSANDLIASPDKGVIKGVINAVKVGKTTITYSFGGKTALVNIIVIPKPESITVSTTKIVLEKGKSFDAKITAYYSDKTSKDISSIAKWETTNNTIATVKSGSITAVKTAKAGNTATVTVSYNDFKANIDVKIVDNVKSLTTNFKAVTLPLGDSKDIVLTATYVNLKQESVQGICAAVSSNPAIATIVDGKITAIANGKATITYTYGSKRATTSVSVKPTLRGFAIDPKVIYVEVGKTSSVKAMAYYSTNKTEDVTKLVEWDTYSGNYLSFSNGIIKAKKITTDAPIVVNAKLGKSSASTSIYIIPVIKTFKTDLPTSSITIFQGQIKQINLWADSDDVTSKAIMTSSNLNYVTVDNLGIKGVKTGTSKVTYKYGSKVVSITVTVKPSK